MARQRAERTAEPHQLDATQTVCICPICRQLHKVKMNWTGRGMPRKFCMECRQCRPSLFWNEEPTEYRYGGQRERTFPISEMPLIPMTTKYRAMG